MCFAVLERYKSLQVNVCVMFEPGFSHVLYISFILNLCCFDIAHDFIISVICFSFFFLLPLTCFLFSSLFIVIVTNNLLIYLCD